jgi:ribulose-phosphate 3-epimerase
MSNPILIATSILSADFTRLGDQIQAAQEAGADWIHVDVMDGHFVPNLTMGPFIVQACRRVTNLPLDVHLMVSEPQTFLEAFAKAGATHLTVHIETCPQLHRILQTIRELGCKPGVVLNPSTTASSLDPVLHLVDLVLVMSVNPGYSGQSFLPEVLPKVSLIRQRLNQLNPTAWLEIDGGINAQTLPLALKSGAQVFVAASAVFKHPHGIAAGIKELRDASHLE